MAPFDIGSKCTGTGSKDASLEELCRDTFAKCRTFGVKEHRDFCGGQAAYCAEETKKGANSFKLKMPRPYETIFTLSTPARCFRAAAYIAKMSWLADYQSRKNIPSSETLRPKPVSLKAEFGTAISILQERNNNLILYRRALSIFRKVSRRSPDSKLGRYASLLKDAMEQSAPIFPVKVVHKNIFIQRFEKVDGLSLIFLKEHPLEPVVVPGIANITWVRSKMEVHIPNYFGKFSVVFKNPGGTISENSAALLEAYHILPNEFFEGFKSMVFAGVKQGNTAGEYSSNVVTMYQGSDPLGTIVHELTHHWDEKVAVGTDGKDMGFGDPSRLFYDISWTPDRIKREIRGADHKKVPMDRRDFDTEAFAYGYGMCNRLEDIASMADYYVTKGRSMRATIREQMTKGKFELAAKYLFVRYIMPFRTREYQLEGDTLGFEEVKKGLETWLKDRAGAINMRVIKAIKRIEEKYNEIKYK